MAGSEKDDVKRRKEDHGWNEERELVDVRDEPGWELRCWKKNGPKGLKCELLHLWGNGTTGKEHNSDAHPKDRNHDYVEEGRTPPRPRNRHRERPQQPVVVGQMT